MRLHGTRGEDDVYFNRNESRGLAHLTVCRTVNKLEKMVIKHGILSKLSV